MNIILHGLHGASRILANRARALTLLAGFLLMVPSVATLAGKLDGWQLEPGVTVPSYAVIDPASTDLNVDGVVLVCEQATHRRILQLQMYLSTDGPLSPNGIAPGQLKDDPRAVAVIDGRVFPVQLLFSDAYVLLADDEQDMFPLLSERLLDAMQTGKKWLCASTSLRSPSANPRASMAKWSSISARA
jgi:hypothetical protein